MQHPRGFAFLLATVVLISLESTGWCDSPPALRPREITAGRTSITLPDTSAYSAVELRILGLERERSAAIARGDTIWLATLYASDFSGIAANGRRVDRADLFRVFARDDPESRFTIDELAVRDYGGAVTVTGRLRTFAAEGELRGDTRYLHVYVERARRWWLVRAQATVVRP